MTGRRVRRPALFSLWRQGTPENSAASRLLGTTSLCFALHGWQRQWAALLFLSISETVHIPGTCCSAQRVRPASRRNRLDRQGISSRRNTWPLKRFFLVKACPFHMRSKPGQNYHIAVRVRTCTRCAHSVRGQVRGGRHICHRHEARHRWYHRMRCHIPLRHEVR